MYTWNGWIMHVIDAWAIKNIAFTYKSLIVSIKYLSMTLKSLFLLKRKCLFKQEQNRFWKKNRLKTSEKTEKINILILHFKIDCGHLIKIKISKYISRVYLSKGPYKAYIIFIPF